MKTLHFIPLAASLVASASAATLYTDSAAFLSSSTWTGAPAGAAFTENFVASGGLHNFTGNEEFASSSYTYGSGSFENTATFARTDSGNILVDTSNESGGFLSFDNPGNSKYLYVPANGGGEGITISFSQPITAFGFRIGDFGDPSSGSASLLSIISRDALDPQVTSQLALSISPTTGDKAWTFVGWTFESPIDQISLSQPTNNNDSWGVDTVSFVTVPEPSTAVLCALGVGALIRRRRVSHAAV